MPVMDKLPRVKNGPVRRMEQELGLGLKRAPHPRQRSTLQMRFFRQFQPTVQQAGAQAHGRLASIASQICAATFTPSNRSSS